MSLRVLAALCALALPGPSADAHDFSVSNTRAEFAADGTYAIEFTCDLDALALDVPPSTPEAELVATLRAMSADEFRACESRLKEKLRRRVRVRFDGVEQVPTIAFPDLGRPQPAGQPESVFGVTARFSGAAPRDARVFTFWASRAFPPAALAIVRHDLPEPVRHVLGVAEESPPFSLVAAPARPGVLATAAEYARLGFVHIVPHGVDHILFVLGLFLLSDRLRPLLVQVTAFTVAHTLTLALAALGVVSLTSRLVEPLIALSIAYVAIENLCTTRLTPWRPGVVFCFGLLHGLGFAGVLSALGLPRGQLVTALVAFNAGVELGQIAVIAGAMLIVGWFRARAWYRPAVVVPASLLIAAVGLFWAVQRSLAPAGANPAAPPVASLAFFSPDASDGR